MARNFPDSELAFLRITVLEVQPCGFLSFGVGMFLDSLKHSIHLHQPHLHQRPF